MRSLMRESKHYSGDYLEVDIFPVRKNTSCRKAKAKPSSETQKKLNQKNAARRLTWLIQENFGTNDLYLGLSYPSDLYIDNGTADKKLRNFLRRLKRKYNKQGFELKYITTTEVGTKKKHPHHHVIVSGELPKQVIRDEWNKQFKKNSRFDFAYIKNLVFTRTGLAGVAFYTCKDPSLAYKSYNCSKNLKRVEPQKRDGRISRRKVEELRQDCFNAEEFEKLYPGYEFVDADPYWDMFSVDTDTGELGNIDFPYISIRFFRKDSRYILRDKDRM